MWPKNYKDYPEDESLVQNQVEPGHGIVGCEMHDLNGWGDKYEELVSDQGEINASKRKSYLGDRY